MRPFGPLPFSAARSMPACFAMRRASGETKIRSPPASWPLPLVRGRAALGAAGCAAPAARPAARRPPRALAARLRLRGRSAGSARRPASAAPPRPASTRIAIGSFTFTPSVPSRDQDPAQHALIDRLDLHRRLVGLDLGDHVAGLAPFSPSFFSQRASVPSVIVGLTAPASGCWSPCCRSPQTIFFTASTTHSGCGSASFSRLAA